MTAGTEEDSASCVSANRKERGRMAELAVVDELNGPSNDQSLMLSKTARPIWNARSEPQPPAWRTKKRRRKPGPRTNLTPSCANVASCDRTCITHRIPAGPDARAAWSQGSEAELAGAAETRDGTIPFELWDVRRSRPSAGKLTRYPAAPGTVGVNSGSHSAGRVREFHRAASRDRNAARACPARMPARRSSTSLTAEPPRSRAQRRDDATAAGIHCHHR